MIRFTRHAKNRLRHAEISLNIALDAINHPDDEYIAEINHIIKWKKIANGFLKLICVSEGENLIIITAVFKSRRGKHENHL
jgi:hypothetical protein